MDEGNNNPQFGNQPVNSPQTADYNQQPVDNSLSATIPLVPPLTREAINADSQATDISQKSVDSISSGVVNPPAQPGQIPPPTPNIPVEDGKKNNFLMTIAIIFFIVGVVVAIGYIVFTKFIVSPVTPTPVATEVPIEEILPTEEPMPEVTPDASDSGVLGILPSASTSAKPMSSSTPSATTR